MKVLVVGDIAQEDTGKSMPYFQDVYSRILKSSGANVRYSYYDDLLFEYSEALAVYIAASKIDVATYDVVILKGAVRYSFVAAALSRYLAKKGTPFFNDYSYYRSINKVAQLVDMDMLGIRAPKTVFSLSHQHLMQYIYTNHKPVVIKAINGSRGNNNFLAHTSDDANEIFANHPNLIFMVQDYVEKRSEYRIFTVDKEHVIFELNQVNQETHLGNYSKGARRTELTGNGPLPDDVLVKCTQWANYSGFVVSGIDVIRDKQESYQFLEINSQPGWTESRMVDKLLEQYVQKIVKKMTARRLKIKLKIGAEDYTIVNSVKI
jgi:glutathione synthase/RimK-type ligase-like ATP-grasp enzyme